ncbi:MAG: NAD-dependent epimerase/dehydratase family protein [Flavobacteriaceae bacterium]|nr:NAD-dependent epimerase/dehydratase family protein [Pelagibacteraceae bacterium]MBT6170145.1 NAD-dependent epimerase/dehydratase family protein [Flavobacteriaceae bacterium]MBT6448721.1 NAD-dependent epimerase/dehydratase family protein [Flavobacteriaceae bacterium]MBT7403387.1 NAD-dependent epimerase/dehydratase family protein [Flavobacteriaceae bacterium]
MKIILVTGGAGFIGSNLIKKLIKNGHNVTSLDNYTTGKTENEVAGVNYIDDDIENIIKLKTKFDVCFHLAAQSRVQPSFDNPQESVRINVTGTTRVMEWARINNVKVIYAGSSSKHHDPSDSPYAMTKFLGEEICKLYKKSFNVNVEIARFYNVYGPIEPIDEKFGNVIGIWRAKVKKSLPLPIVGDGNQKRDFTHVFDIVDGLLKISKTEIKHDDAWEIGTGVNYSINELFLMFKQKFNADSIYIPDQKGNYRETLRVNDDLINLLNWQPEDRLREYIANLNKI